MLKKIVVKGAKEHNLKNVSLEIPKEKLVVITGLSGSGKSSLAFDTIYAEGQRRYVESLSSYARQFLGKLNKPKVESIKGISPAIAIEQRSGAGNPRSTIATTTEIYDYLRLLFAHVAQPHCPDTGQPISHHTTSDIVHEVMEQEEQTRLMVLAPITLPDGALPESVLEELARDGFLRVRINGAFMEIGEVPPGKELRTLEVVVDRLVLQEKARVRLADSLETALRLGGGVVHLLLQPPSQRKWKSNSIRSPKSTCIAS